MPGDPRIRASDADRDRAAALLREHHAAGRLTAAEFHDRLEQAMEAATLGDIDNLMSDLPAIDLYELPDASLRRQNRSRQNRSSQSQGLSQVLSTHDPAGGQLEDLQAAKMAIAAWATVAGALVTIGLVTGIAIGGLSPWWVFAFIPAGAVFWLWFLFRRSQH
ncbi:MAG TPA: DUF1707 domain-containing protein [Streptosporangiaceae bacterium]|nr:DUF1707 domain-containing protein [Streptosporangiaceae bacterium]